ncbi:MAG: CHAT domain-containing protein [Chloroflexi bacterium]|nr:CHAT domain-containing protein [Chloroflexota bacterium]
MTDSLQTLYEKAARAEREYQAGHNPVLLDQAQERWQELLNQPDFAALPPVTQAHCLNRLGLVCWRQYWDCGQRESLPAALSYWHTAVTLTPATTDEYPLLHTHLSVAYQARFDQAGDEVDLDTAVFHAQQAIQSAPPEYVHHPAIFNNLGSALRSRYQRTNNFDDLDNALSAWTEALACIPDDHPERPSILHNRSLGLLERYEHTGQLADLQSAVTGCQTAVALAVARSNDKPIYCNTLGTALIARYRQLGEIADLDAASAVWQTAVDLTPPTSAARPQHLNNLGNGWRAKFEQSGQLSDLEQALVLWQEAVALTPATSPERARHLLNLGAGYKIRYGQTYRRSDLDAAITHYETAVSLTPVSSPAYSLHLANLATSYLTRFEQEGQAKDLQAALDAYEKAVARTRPASPEYPLFLAMRGQGLQSRFIHWGRMDDLDQSIADLQQACDLTPTTALNRPLYLSNLAESLRRRWQFLGKTADLERALSAARAAVALSAAKAPQRSVYLSILGALLHAQYQETGNAEELQAAIHTLQEAVNLASSDNSDRARYLTSLGSCWQDQYRQSGDLVHLDTAVGLHQQAIAMLSPSDILYPTVANNLGASLNQRHRAIVQETGVQKGSAPDLVAQAARAAYEDACKRGLERDPFITLQCAQTWGNWAMERGTWAEALDAYAYGAQVMTALYSRQTSQQNRNAWLRQGWRLYLQIAYSLARCGAFQEAVLTLEWERARWLQAELGSETAAPAMAERISWEQITAVSQEPLIYLLVSHLGGLALIVNQGAVTPLWFAGDETTWNQRLLHRAEADMAGGYLAAQLGIIPLQPALDALWPWLAETALRPIQQTLQTLAPMPPQTITLIPTGRLALLPWHAVPFQSPESWLVDCAICYAPSALTLWRSQQRPSLPSRPRLVAVAAPFIPGLADLPYAEWETAAIAPYFQPDMQKFAGTEARKTAVLPTLSFAHYLHFACHGEFTWQDPLFAGLYLSGDERLTLADIQQGGDLSLTRLVFLSACQTGINDFDQAPDEAISLAAGFLQIGVKGVIATLWPTPDLSTALLVQRFYQYHIQESRPPSRALHLAQRWLMQVTAEELAITFARLRQRNDERRPLFSTAWRRFAVMEAGERPFNHPYYWAAFTFTGV